jgi:hypothetical protein
MRRQVFVLSRERSGPRKLAPELAPDSEGQGGNERDDETMN